ncbi:hypothetical protein HK405_011752 [Cladochytrium tenue]|nr:hypothetical protein HK405_011752 [Cladochytrium tenue]
MAAMVHADIDLSARPVLVLTPHLNDLLGTIGYLTIQEGYVEPGVSQRRPGLHIDSPRYYKVGEDSVYDFSELKPRGFGFGSSGPSRQGGVFQVSSVPDTCRVWDCIVQDPGEIVGPLGNLEHLRHDLDSGPPRGVTANDPNSYGARRRPSLLPPTRRNGENLAACRLAWMTDRTPQESLPVPRRLFRQYFCLVTSSVTAWYEAHSTRNDECKIVPPFGVEIVRGDMFRAPGVDRHSDPDAPAEFL